MNKVSSVEVNPWEYPLEYFEAQVQFAGRWAEITGESFVDALATRTAVKRRLDVDNEQLGLIVSSAEYLGSTIFDLYKSDEANLYKPKERSMLGYDYRPQDGVVKIHFTNYLRGERPFDEAGMKERRREMERLLREVKATHPEARSLMSASWLRSTKKYVSLSPPDVDEPLSIMSSDMKFGGNSLWGQFMDFRGNANQRVCDMFFQALRDAKTLEELLAAFPYPVRISNDDIEKYYGFYSIE